MNDRANTWHTYKGETTLDTLAARQERFQGAESRQVLRARLRDNAFVELTGKYPGEPRKLRRTMARKLASRQYRDVMGLGKGERHETQ